MTIGNILRKILIFATTAFTALSAIALPSGFFSSKSRLSSGDWVKITTGESGIYEISYDDLRMMGFNNPEKVGVYGRGGAMLDENFTDASGSPIYTDDIQPVPVLHSGNKIFFYVFGSSAIRYRSETASPQSRRFERKSMNIYSETGTYFLSQGRPDIKRIEEAKAQEFDYRLPAVTECWDYMYHERDMVFNINQSGQQFWGEDFLTDRTQLIAYNLPGAVTSEPASLECRFVHSGDNSTVGTKVEYGFDQNPNGTIKASLSYLGQYNTYTSATPYSAKISMPATSGNIKITYLPNGNPTAAYLDYILLGYKKEIRFNDGESQFRAFIPDYDPRKQSYMIIANATPTTVVWNIASPQHATYLPVLYNNDGTVNSHYLTPSQKEGLLMVFDTEKPQKRILSYEPIANQNLHGINTTPDMLIITTDERKADAETLADLHRHYDDMDVLVVTSRQVINEFSGGTPDAMAYRGIVKMFHDRTPGKLRNVLLFGPILADNRQITRKAESEMLISYQSEESDRVEHTYAINDFHGYMKDYYGSEQSGDNMYMRPLDVPVAILPVRSHRDAEIIINKTAQAITDESYPYWLGSTQFIGDSGDENQHALYSDYLAQTLTEYSGGDYVTRKIFLDGFPIYQAKDRFIRNLNEGSLFSIYFGHGDVSSLSGSGTLWNNIDIFKLHNRRLGFITVAGCNVTKLDNNFRGATEKLVFSEKSGVAGGLLTNRVGWSQQNLEFVRQLQNALYLESPDNPGKLLSTPRTIGETYALAKSRTFNSNKFIYQLMVDPALIFPVPTASVEVTSIEGKGVTENGGNLNIVPGSGIKISGCIKTRGGNNADAFKGKAVISIYDNAYTEQLANYISNSKDRISATFDENLLVMTETDVIDGKFSTALTLPRHMNQSGSQLPATIRVAAYEPATRTAALGSRKFYPAENDPSVEETDEKAPEILEFYIDTPEFSNGQTVPSSFTVFATITDDLSLDISDINIGRNMTLELDGKRSFSNVSSFAHISNSGREATMRFPMSGITIGQHTLTLSASDNSGKTARQSITFNVANNECTGKLTASPRAVTDKCMITFTPSCSDSSTDAELIITDSDGKAIFRKNMADGTLEWDATDAAGNRVSPGIYNAYCLLKGETRKYGVSTSLKLIILKPLSE